MKLEHRTTKAVGQGSPYPLGATLLPDGVNFAIYSRNASEVFLLLFDRPDGEPTDVLQLRERDKFVWHAHVAGVKAGQLYGTRCGGDYRPDWGLRFNDAKLLLDPYARAVTGKFRNTDNLLLAYDPQPGAGDRIPDRLEGEPNYVPVDSTQLLYAKNTSARVFKLLDDKSTYVLISGRWYRAASFQGPWTHVAATQLPKEFAKIPDSSPVEDVKASVPGTRQAQEALIANSVPQTAAEPRRLISLDPASPQERSPVPARAWSAPPTPPGSQARGPCRRAP
jgi:hypothetical protein